MTARWQYFYEELTLTRSDFTQRFNDHLNKKADAGWELVSAPLETYADKGTWYTWAKLIWRRSPTTG